MQEGKKILLVEDDADARSMMRFPLARDGHRVLEADRIAVAEELLRREKPDLMVLDIELPDGSGLELCSRMRKSKEHSSTPIILLTGSRIQLEDKELGFLAGADHYLVKPVALKELALWVNSLLRRLALDSGEGQSVVAGELVLEPGAHVARYKGNTLAGLTRKEFELLVFLVRKRPAVLSRKYILSNLWHTVAVDRLVDAHISNLRKKLPVELADRIQSVPGKGYLYLE